MLNCSWGLRKARVWLNEAPDWHYKASGCIEHVEPSAYKGRIKLSSAALELSLPMGAMIYYGGIAVTFVLSEEQKLIICIPTLDRGRVYTEALVSNVKAETVYTGFPSEYAKSFLDAVVRSENLALMGQGSLQVCGAVHGQVGSSPWMFGALGRSLVKLLSLSSTDVSEGDVVEIIRTELR